MFRRSFTVRACNHLTGYAAFSKVSFKMPVMKTVPGGFINKNKVSHKAWDLLGNNGRAEYSKVGKGVKIAMIKRQKNLQRKQKLKIITSYKYHHTKHPGWKRFVRKNYHTKEVESVPFEQRMDLLASMHERVLREKRRFYNRELRKQKRDKKKNKVGGKKKKVANK